MNGGRTWFTTCPPGVRMVVIHASASPGEDAEDAWRYDHEFYPVVALRFWHTEGDCPPGPEAQGRSATRIEPIIVDPELGIGPLAMIDGPRVANVMVACPWSIDQDETRLAEWIAYAEQQARRKAEGESSPAGPAAESGPSA